MAQTNLSALAAVPGPEPAAVPVLDSAAGTGTEATVPVPVPVAPVPKARAERIRLAFARWAGTVAGAVRQLWLHPDRVLHVLWHGKPESMAEHRAYVKSRAWVPGELSGNTATVIAVAGIIYHLAVARPVKAAARTIDAAAERPLRLLMLAVFTVVLIHILH